MDLLTLSPKPKGDNFDVANIKEDYRNKRYDLHFSAPKAVIPNNSLKSLRRCKVRASVRSRVSII